MASFFRRRRNAGQVTPKAHVPRPGLEALETREVPATVFAVTVPSGGTQPLIRCDSASPGTVTPGAAISGLVGGAGETVVDIDIRPSNGTLYAVTNTAGTGRLYTVSTTTGAAAPVSAGTTFPLMGTAFGADFNPTND